MAGYSFTIPGSAAPQGSKKYVGKSKKTGAAVLVEQSTKVAPWRKIVHAAAVAVVDGADPLDGPCGVEIAFYFARPRAAAHRKYPHKAGPGDIDKLQRSTFDAFTTAKLWTDDARVCRVIADKLYAEPGTEPRCEVHIWEMD